ncbi:oligosaccharide flippase family protein [Facklamia sp. DSM 111018]|uniref:Oligosaccharide flippase family protein n=1 Tax=Facklamia lactis TaxID=2749967 RepID=A0ABS0LRJ9_9LACT|nr:oligosaccharide flippase family protein [Facklamia lactis]MBG9980849.1 oligosaccharide flippase family protein [Facklamia lactis]MBG9986788.1 oligosaccharide flippase family protein [Facklamia lactis]
MKYFLKRLMGFSMGPIIGALISIIQIPILTRLMLPDEYGVSGLYRTLMLYLPNFIYVGLDQSFSREFHQISDKKYLFQQASLIPFVLGSIFALIAMFFNQELSMWMFEDSKYGYIIILSGWMLLAMIIERFVLLSIRMQEKAKEYSAFTILLKLSIFIVSIGFVLLGVRDFRVIVLGMIVGQLLGDGLLFIRYRDLLNPIGFNLDKVLLLKLLKFGFPLMLAMSLNSVLNLADNFMLKTLSNKTELGYYSAGIGIVNVIGILKTAFATFWTPTAYRWHEEQKSIKHFKYISDALLFILTGMFFAILVFRPLVMLVVGKQYEPTKYILGLLSFPHIMYTLSETTTLGIVFSRKTYLNIVVSVLTLIPSFGLNLWLTPQYGALGAAAASCGAYIMFYTARTFFSSRTGFYFNQRKHFLTILLMLFASIINAVNMDNRLIMTFLIGIGCLLVQFSTIQDTLKIIKQPEEWDFN